MHDTLSETPLKVCIDRYLPDVEHTTDIVRIALLRAKLWQPGTTLRVAYSGGTTAQRRKVMETCEVLMRYANIDFREAAGNQKGDIRITFNPGGGAWSYIGTDVAGISSRSATMNLGFDDGGTYMHEFGHTLGAIHEHQNPAGGIKWNKEQVIRDLSGPPNNWDRQTIEHNMFEAYSRDMLNGTTFDPKSIMLYAIPKRWTTDGFSSQANSVLSETDKMWLAKNYPGRDVGEPDVKAVDLPLYNITPWRDNIASAGERDLFTLKIDDAGAGLIRIEALGILGHPRNASVVIRVFGPNDLTTLVPGGQTNNTGVVDRGINARLDLKLGVGTYYVQVTHADPAGTGEYALRAIKFSDGDPFLGPRAAEGVLIRTNSPIELGEYTMSKVSAVPEMEVQE